MLYSVVWAVSLLTRDLGANSLTTTTPNPELTNLRVTTTQEQGSNLNPNHLSCLGNINAAIKVSTNLKIRGKKTPPPKFYVYLQGS